MQATVVVTSDGLQLVQDGKVRMQMLLRIVNLEHSRIKFWLQRKIIWKEGLHF